MTTDPQRTGRSRGLLAAAVVSLVLAALSFVLLDDVVIAGFVAILLVTAAVMAFLASDWDRHTTFEEREQQRALRRKAKWEANAEARERDRRRWEAHQARRTRQPGDDRDDRDDR